MEVIESVINAISELLIENRTMKKLLRGGATDLDKILRDAKADPEAQRRVEMLLSPLRTAIGDEVAVEQFFQDIAKKTIDNEPN